MRSRVELLEREREEDVAAGRHGSREDYRSLGLALVEVDRG